MNNPLHKTDKLLQTAARIAKRQGLSLEFTAADLGDLYHVYGVNATATKFVRMLKQRAQAQTIKAEA